MRKALIATLSVAGWLGAPQVHAHHSFGMYDGSRKVTLEGTVRDFQWSNPHVWIQLVVAPAGGGKPVEYSIEAPAINGLARVGWNSRSLKPGDKIKIDVHPLRDGGPGGALILVTLADGRTLGQTMIQKSRDQSAK